MDPVLLEMKNFTCYSDEAVDLSQDGFIALSGPNFSGKSSLVDAILFALYGQASKGGARSLDDYVRSGEDEVQVALYFLHEEHQYKVVRTRTRGKKTTLQLYRAKGDAWEDLSAAKISDTQELIESIIRLDYRSFVASALILQGQSSLLTASMTDIERKQVLANILDLGVWDKFQELAKAKRQKLHQELSELDVRIEGLAHDVGFLPDLELQLHACKEDLLKASEEIASLERQIEQAQEKIAQMQVLEQKKQMVSQRLQDLRKQAADIEKETSSIQSQAERYQAILKKRLEIEQAHERLQDCIQQIAELEEKQGKHLAMEEKVRQLQQEQSRWSSEQAQKIAVLEASIQAAQSQSALLAQVPCQGTSMQNSCKLLGSALEAKDKLPALLEEKAEVEGQKNPFFSEIERAVFDLACIGYDESVHRELLKEREELSAKASQLPLLQEAQDQTQQFQKRLDELASRREVVQEAITSAAMELKDIAESLSDVFVSGAGSLDGLRQRLAQVRQAESKYLSHSGALKARIDDLKEKEASLKELRGQRDVLARKALVYETLEQAGGKRSGVPALVLENAVPQIEASANDILLGLSAGRLAVSLDTQVETKSGSVSEALRVTVLDGGNARSYLTYSGAERFMVDLSLRIAISKFLSWRRGASVRLLVIDEGIASADSEHRQKIVDAIFALQGEFSKVIVITHLDEVRDRFTQRLEVVPSPAGSTVRLIA